MVSASLYVAMGIIQALIAVILWFVVYYRTGHRGGWLIIPFFPILGVLFTPLIVGWYYSKILTGSTDINTMPIVMSMLTFLTSIVPLVVLTVRLLRRRVMLSRVYASDVFGD